MKPTPVSSMLTRRATLSLGLAGATAIALPSTLRAQVLGHRPDAEAGASAPRVARLPDPGHTRRLEVLPLVDWNTTGSPLRGEAGVSYLVRTDRSSVLLDVGGNLEGTSPSPLMANLKALGLGLADFDTVLITHNHMDHVGGLANARATTFSLDKTHVDLAGKRVFVPSPMSYPGVQPVVAAEPLVLAPGVVATGAIRMTINVGPVDEQALAVRVAGKGIVLVVGCGHQGLANLLARTAQLFDDPLYGVIGGLHYPIPRGRWALNGVDMQRWATWGLSPGPTADDVQRDIDRLRATGVQWVSLSPHDSSDEMIELFRRNFGPAYHDLRLGEAQVLSAG